jgi:hypothetical protein
MRKVAGSIPFGIIGIFHCLDTSGRPVSLGSTKSVTHLSNRDISWGGGGRGGRCVGLTTLPPSCADCLRNNGNISLLEPSRAVQVSNGIALPNHNLKVNRNGLVHAVTRVWLDEPDFEFRQGPEIFIFSRPFPGVKQLGLGVNR